MNDRESIVKDLRRMAESAHENKEMFSPRVLRELAERFERGDDLKPVKAPATVADLLGLNDLDLGALVTRCKMAEDAAVLCAVFKSDAGERYQMARSALCDVPADWTDSARRVASIGAKVRAALSQKTSKPAEPRILQSHEDAPCGSLWACLKGGPLTMRWPSGDGRNVPKIADSHLDAWLWVFAAIDFPARLVAEGLTEAECRLLSGMDRQGALAWCEKREAALLGSVMFPPWEVVVAADQWSIESRGADVRILWKSGVVSPLDALTTREAARRG